LGADVVKVEPPDGDITQLWGEVRAGRSGFYFQQNAGKRSIGVDLKAEGGVELVSRLAAESDIVIENFRPGVADRLGIGWAALSARNAGLIMLSISGYGQDDQPAERGAFAPIIHAASGLVLRQSVRDHMPATDPMLSIADLLAGLHGMVALLAALHLRESTGQGQHIDMAMLDAMLATDEYTHHYLDGSPVAKLGGLVWQAADGPIMIAADQRHTWLRLSAVHGLLDHCPSNADAGEKIAARVLAITNWLAQQDRSKAHLALADADLLSADVVSPESAIESVIDQRGMVAEVAAGDGGTRRVLQLPYRFSAATSKVRGPAPALAEHNADVLYEWLDAADEEISTLTERGILVRAGSEWT
jgi:CoA:oxalate CoA-transferase